MGGPSYNTVPLHILGNRLTEAGVCDFIGVDNGWLFSDVVPAYVKGLGLPCLLSFSEIP